jgi:hypothetical protein
MASNPSMSFSSAPHRPLGLIAIVLIIDLGLAASGAFLLAKGMSEPETADKPADKKSELPAAAPPVAAATQPVVETTVVAVVPAAATTVSATPIAMPASAEAPTAVTPAATAARKSPSSISKASAVAGGNGGPAGSTGPVTSPSSPDTSPPVATPVTTVPTTPVQPLQPPPSTAVQIETLGNQSAMAFERCRGDQPIAGAITIAFNVQSDGSVTNHAAVENTTGNAELGACLARVIGGWRVSPFQGNTMSFVRPFHYP